MTLSTAQQDWSDVHIPEVIRDVFQTSQIPLTLASCRLDDLPLVLANEPFEELTGYSQAELLGRNCRFLQGSNESNKPRSEIRTAIASKRDACISLVNERKDGSLFLNKLFLFPIFALEGSLEFYLGTQFEEQQTDPSKTVGRHMATLGQLFRSVDDTLSADQARFGIDQDSRDQMISASGEAVDQARRHVSISVQSIIQSKLLVAD